MILLPVALALIIFGGLPLLATLSILSAIAMTELYKSFSLKITVLNIFSYISLAVYYFFIDKMVEGFFLAFLILYLMINLSIMVILHKKVTPYECIINIFSFVYAVILMSTVYFVRQHSIYMLWVIVISAWGSDTFAYFVGKFIGKHKLIPDLSPNKTVEGSLGGVVGAMAVGFLFTIILDYPDVLYFVIACGVGAVFGQIGDLAASAIKRHNKIKDYGNLIPGHGGIMDRFDSLLFTAPIIYVFVEVLL